MQNAELLCRLCRRFKTISGGNTFILHSSFFILHFERQLGKLKFEAGGGVVSVHPPAKQRNQRAGAGFRRLFCGSGAHFTENCVNFIEFFWK